MQLLRGLSHRSIYFFVVETDTIYPSHFDTEPLHSFLYYLYYVVEITRKRLTLQPKIVPHRWDVDRFEMLATTRKNAKPVVQIEPVP